MRALHGAHHLSANVPGHVNVDEDQVDAFATRSRAQRLLQAGPLHPIASTDKPLVKQPVDEIVLLENQYRCHAINSVYRGTRDRPQALPERTFGSKSVAIAVIAWDERKIGKILQRPCLDRLRQRVQGGGGFALVASAVDFVRPTPLAEAPLAAFASESTGWWCLYAAAPPSGEDRRWRSPGR